MCIRDRCALALLLPAAQSPGGYQQTWVLPDKVILAQTPPPAADVLRGFFTVSAAGRPGGLPCSTPVSQVSSHSPCAHQTSPPPAGGSRAPCVPVAPDLRPASAWLPRARAHPWGARGRR